MSKILGLDLGTNSIGWAVRDTEELEGVKQITHKGAIVFEQGVGEKKGIEFSLAAERTTARTSRKKNMRRRWRKIELLGILIKENMCPLPIAELEDWSKPKRKTEKKYPTNDLFKNWLRLDFNNDGTEDYKNPFELRKEALERKLTPDELGRIFYHLTQRRGYLSNRSEKARDTEETADGDIEENDDKPKKKLGKVAKAIIDLEEKLEGKTIGQQLYEEIENGSRARRRKDESTNIYRLTLQEEFLRICSFQEASIEVTEKIRKIIFEQRPLKSQKGTIGKCIYEKNKSRCPVSHPEFELYRMWQVLNNIKYSDDDKKSWQSLNADDRKKVQEKFFRKSCVTFPFSDIKKIFGKHFPNRVFNYKDYQTVAGCPMLAGLMNVLGEDNVWQLRDAAIQRIEWEEHEKKMAKGKYHNTQIDLYDIWHWLFVMDNDKDEEIVKKKAIESLGLSEKEARSFVNTSIKQGYGSLSLKAIRKINKWLEVGEKYDKAVFLANIPYVFERQLWLDNKEGLTEAIQKEIEQIAFQKSTIDIANSLIKKYNGLPYTQRFANDKGYKLDADDLNGVKETIENYFGNKKWNTISGDTKSNYEDKVAQLYQDALSKGVNGDIAFIKMPRLEDNIKIRITEMLSLNPDDKRLDKLYHPSEIESFLPAINEKDKEGNNTGRKLLDSPKTDSIRNPMAMRSLYELKKLLNYLLKNDVIDEQTNVIVEMARELNDANRRKAIERYQRERESENTKYASEIKKIFEEQKKTLPEDLTSYIERYRLREEQPKRVCMYTGNTICDADLFDEFTTDIEHTLPRSLTFDDSFQNKTIAFKNYNNEIKNKLLPTQLPNYPEAAIGYDPIEPRLENWKKLVKDYETKVEICKKRSKMASTKEAKDKAIEDKHYNQIHYAYWKSKLERFTITEITERFKNSQLVDTQIIAKYGVLYLKTLFYRVRSTKGILTDKIKRVWGAMSNDEKKDRSQHTHHTVDAIIQTLLHKERNKPDVYNLLAEGYKEAEANRWKEPKIPNPWGLAPDGFFSAMQQLTSDVIIYHADRDNVLKQTKRKERFKKQIVYTVDKEGNKIPRYQRGRGIRASLHKDTFYGAIKIPIKENGKLKTDDNGKLLLEKDEKGNDIIKYRSSFVFRGNTVDAIKKNIENIVDERLRELAKETGAATIHKQGFFEIPPNEERLKKNPDAEATKVFKVKVFADNLQNPLQIKKHRDVKREHKQWYYTQTDGNYLMALYDNGKEKDFELINTYQLTELVRMGQGQYPLYKEKLLRGKQIQMPLIVRNRKDVVLKPGLKVLLCEKSFDEVTSDLSANNLIDRLYSVSGLTVQRIKSGGNVLEYGTIHLMHHLEAKSLGELKIQDGEYKFKDGKKYRKLNHNQFRGLVEGIDFRVSRDGIIHLL